jgi:hypothetical protein
MLAVDMVYVNVGSAFVTTIGEWDFRMTLVIVLTGYALSNLLGLILQMLMAYITNMLSVLAKEFAIVELENVNVFPGMKEKVAREHLVQTIVLVMELVNTFKIFLLEVLHSIILAWLISLMKAKHSPTAIGMPRKLVVVFVTLSMAM